MQPCTYLLASKKNGTLYIGVTSNPIRRIAEHQSKTIPGFTQKYNVTKLVWYELHETMESAIMREKAMKAWKRDWKIELIEKANPDWHDLYHQLL